MSVHSRAWVLGERLRHECRVNTLFDCNLFDNGSESHDVVGHCQSICVAKIDFVLTRATLVVTELDRDSELLEHRNCSPSEVVCGAARNVVEVAGLVYRNRTLFTKLSGFEQVELDFRVNVERKAQV